MEKENNNVLIGVILGGLATIGVITAVVAMNKKKIFTDISEEFLKWREQKDSNY